MSPAAPSPGTGRFEIRVDPRPPLHGQRSPPYGRRLPEPGRRAPAGAARLPWLRATIASTFMIGILVALAGKEEEAPAGRSPPAMLASVAAAPPSAWRPLPTSEPLYSLEGTRFSARLHPELGREDTLVVGALGEGGPHLRLVLQRGPARAHPSLFVDLARRAGAVGIGIVRSGRAGAVETKFGPVEVADAVLAGEAERGCLGFRFGQAEIGFGMTGWLCEAADRAARKEDLACLLDRLTLAPTTDDPAMTVLFAQAERRRLSACETPRVVAEHRTPERIPAELFVSGAAPSEPPSSAPKPGRSRR